MSEKKSMSINLVTSLVVFVVNMGISFFLTPYVTSQLGTDAYGFVSLANNFVNYATLLTLALNSMASRFISIEIHKNREKEASEYFSSVFWANLLIISILIIPAIVLIFYLEKILEISPDLIGDVKILFSLIFLNFCVGIISSTYQVATFATNKLYLQSITNLGSHIIKAAILLVAFIMFVPHVFYVGVASLVASLFILLMNFYYKSKLLSNIKNKLNLCSLNKIMELIKAGVWNTVSRLGGILADGLDLIICNLFIDSFAMGKLAVAKTLVGTVGTLMSTVSGVFQPELIIYYAKEKKNELLERIKISMKTTGIFSNIPFCFLVVFGKLFFDLWMPGQDTHLLYILTILTLQGVITSGVITPLYSIYTITNKIKVDALCRVGIGFLSTIIVFLLLKFTNLGIYAVAATSTTLGIIFNTLFVPIYVSKVCLKLKWNALYPTVFRYVFTLGMILVIFFGMKQIVYVENWLEFFVLVFIAGIIGLLVNFIILLNGKERNEIIKIVKKRLLRLKVK